jgi:hypothetical protein
MKKVGLDAGAGSRDPYKSEGERQVARLLDRAGIPYRYEYPMAVLDGGKVRIWYPDFHLPEYGVVVECVGMRGDRRYNAQLEHKRRAYAEMGIPVIFVTPESFQGYWPGKVMGAIERILGERLDVFRQKGRRLSDWQGEEVPKRALAQRESGVYA